MTFKRQRGFAGLAELKNLEDLILDAGPLLEIRAATSNTTAGPPNMNPTYALSRAGQSLWLDNITRELLTSGTLARYIAELSVTGLTSNPTIFNQAIKKGTAYDAAIREAAAGGPDGREAVLRDRTGRHHPGRGPVSSRSSSALPAVDGWVSLEVSPRLAYDTQATLRQVQDLHARAGRPNLFIKIPGTAQGLPAIEEAVFAGVPINVTLLFAAEQYLAAAEASVARHRAAGSRPT